MTIEFRTIPGFRQYEVSGCGKIRNASTLRHIVTHINKRERQPRATLRNDGGTRTTITVRRLMCLAYGLPYHDKRLTITSEDRAAVLRLVKQDPSLTYAQIGEHVHLSDASVKRILDDYGLANTCAKMRRAKWAEPVRGGDGPDEWSRINKGAAARDAAFAAAGRHEDMPAWVLERELRCLRRGPSRPPTAVASASSMSALF